MFTEREAQTFDICEFCRYNPPSSFGGKPCTVCPASGREIETNADRIKAMSDEELARWLCSIIPGIVQKLRDELARVTAERDAAVKTIFEWTGCPECKQWDSENEWCMKHDREADSSDGCNTPEWRGTKEG